MILVEIKVEVNSCENRSRHEVHHVSDYEVQRLGRVLTESLSRTYDST